MADTTIWKNVAVAMESASATAITITGITNASPPVVTSAAHGLTDGDIVFLEVPSMPPLYRRLARVASSDTNTFQLEGFDLTNTSVSGTFTSGTAAEITFGTAITSATTVNASGGDFDFIDDTTIHQQIKSQVPNMPSAIQYAMDHKWDPADAGQVAMKTASEETDTKCFRMTFPSGKKFYFHGYVGFSGAPAGSAQQMVTCSSTISLTNFPTTYSS